ncbi:hypothetical protein LCGC14_1649590 [marine sediment metagenome]|uniref:Uncharacterized protein n=1 Tax=marine sediment metagenome TaxID=412755 RepID=A0A0F9HY46_9ZZZZ
MIHGSAIWHCISPECRDMLRPFLSPDFVEPRNATTPWSVNDVPFGDVETAEEIGGLIRERPYHAGRVT